jgi:ABC-type phosphate/phosphonate transport system substrate-binding protein
MHSRRAFVCLLVMLPVVATLVVAGDTPVKSFHITISDSVIRGQTTPAAAMIQMQPMSELFAIMGGVKPQFSFESADNLAANLQSGKTQLGIISGIELGWLGDKAKGLTPLAIASTSDIKLKAYVLARTDKRTPRLRDMQGKKLSMPRRTQQHTQIFLHNSLTRDGLTPHGFFASSPVPPDTDAAIEAVLDKEMDLVVIDGQSWEVYQERKPGRAKKLMVIAESPNFPTAALVYKPGNIPDAELKKLQDGLFTAHNQPFCRQILNFWRISQFVPSTPEYDMLVKNIVKEIPEPIIPANFTQPK